MGLSSDLISQFVKTTNDKDEKKNEATVNGTTVEYNGTIYVRLDGSDRLTPISSTAGVVADDRVQVMIKDHEATVTGNLSSPSARTDDVKDIASKISEFEIITAYRVTTEDLVATTATIDRLKAATAKFENMQAVDAKIESLLAKFANLEYFTAKDADIINADIDNLQVMFGEFDNISAEDMEVINACIKQLKGYTADFTYVSADVLSAMRADIKQLDVEKLNAQQADLEYANIDFTNIGSAAMESFYARSGLIENVVVGDQTITGTLVGVTIKGDLIEGNTIAADKLVVKGTDGLYYKLNTDGMTTEAEQTEYNSLNGSIMASKSITASKISVDDLVAFDATIGGFNITDDSLYSGVKESVDNTTRGVYLDNTGQIAFGDSNNFIKYYKDEEGNYKLAIAADTLTLSSGNYATVDDVYVVRDNLTSSISSVSETVDNLSSDIINNSGEIDNVYKLIHTNENRISELIQRNSGFEMDFQTVIESVNQLNDNLVKEVDTRVSYIRFEDGCIYLGKQAAPGEDDFQMTLSNERLSFVQNGLEVAYLSNHQLYIVDAQVKGSFRIGDYVFEMRANGNLGIRYDGIWGKRE